MKVRAVCFSALIGDELQQRGAQHTRARPISTDCVYSVELTNIELAEHAVCQCNVRW